jgi:adenosylcobinamide kinase/adenosylcobinamide-phosphate guanylyltransferase
VIAVNITLLGTAGPAGWPEYGCACASCSRLRAAGAVYKPTAVLVDGIPLAECSRWEVPGGWDVRSASGARLLVASGPGEQPEPLPDTAYDAVLLDLVGHPEHLGLLRYLGAVADGTAVHAVYSDHRISSPAELDRRLRWWTPPSPCRYRTLLLGGSRSGKSAEAELRLAADPHVTYVATGVRHEDDAEWTARIEAHRVRRPLWWDTAETTDVAGRLRSASGSLLIDGLGSWLTAVLDACGGWDDPAAVRPMVDELVGAWRTTGAHVVAVSDEVGLSVVPASSGGRTFSDILGELNQRLAAESEEVALVVAGRVLELPG